MTIKELLPKSRLPENKEISILIVEDDPIVLEVIKGFVDSFGYFSATASDGTEAVESLKKKKYNIIITDINMPNMDGMELLKYTRENYPETGVVVITGLSEEYSYVDVIKNGAIDYMTKPFQGDELLAKIHRVIREQTLVQELEQISIRDSLTGIFNRRYFDQKIVEEVHRGSRQNYPVFLTLLDIDNFKAYNDRLGHQAGDTLLAAVGTILSNSARYGVDYAFRYGGDEFAVIIPETTLDQAQKIVERISKTYNEQGFKGTSLSFGLAEFSRNEILSWEVDIQNFIKVADQRMYTAKNTGKGKIVYK